MSNLKLNIAPSGNALGVQNLTLLSPDGTMKKLTDPSKLHALGWHHQVELEEGIEKMYTWYKESK